MDPEKKKRLGAAGWVFGDAEDFLGSPTVGDPLADALWEYTRAMNADGSPFKRLAPPIYERYSGLPEFTGLADTLRTIWLMTNTPSE